ncbi:MAG: hypothetical protein A2133_09875 [Actinobacteria bacterium RBG_16_64_13]|nr:MAG: hypothetical protein A2133_09875 [Actinobacteria bacterium RBG_16_64_13]
MAECFAGRFSEDDVHDERRDTGLAEAGIEVPGARKESQLSGGAKAPLRKAAALQHQLGILPTRHPQWRG